MNHQDHVYLLQKGVLRPGGIWADFGAGQGAFTLALAELLGPDGQIFSIDKSQAALRQQAQAMQRHFPHQVVTYRAADFTTPISLPALDGVMMANALHFLRHKEPVLQLIREYLKPGGRLLLVEYNTDRGNRWVPHPLTYPTWLKLAQKIGFTHTELLATRPSSFLGQMYAAASW